MILQRYFFYNAALARDSTSCTLMVTQNDIQTMIINQNTIENLKMNCRRRVDGNHHDDHHEIFLLFDFCKFDGE